MVLHNVADDAKFVKVTTTSFGAEGFFEGDLDIVDMLAVPGRAKELVAEAEDEEVLDHFFTKVVVDAEDFGFFPIGFQGFFELAGARKIFAKRLLNDDAGKPLSGVAVALEVLLDGDEDAGRQRHVKDTVLLFSSAF